MDVVHAPDAAFGDEDADVPVRFLRLDDLGDEAILQRSHFFVIGVRGQSHGGVDPLAQADVSGILVPLSKRSEKVLLGVQRQQILIGRDVDASTDLAGNLDLAQIDRRHRGSRRGSVCAARPVAPSMPKSQAERVSATARIKADRKDRA